MDAFHSFVEEVKVTVRRWPTASTHSRLSAELLDGRAADALRQLVPLYARRKAGAFFTGSELAKRLTEPLLDTWNVNSVVWDPACGAGDLLLPFVAATGHADANSRILGRDIHREFVEAARWRVQLAGLVAGWPVDRLPAVAGITAASGLADDAPTSSATHIVLNPPFVGVDAPPGCVWGAGKVNAAALFLEHTVEHARPGARIAAIVPDVLRSGSRYKKWRNVIENRAATLDVQPYGRFDRWADVDVCLMFLEVGASTSIHQWLPPPSRCRVGDSFDVSVGAVVNYRDPLDGPERSYLVSRGLPAFGTVRRIPNKRPFSGRLEIPPFVAVARTSRPGDRYRARGALVVGKRPVAVDNHLLVVRPKDEGVVRCEELLKALADEATTEWLDQRIRCRHLTVRSLADLPWSR